MGVPILVIAYNRVGNLNELLLDIESLPARKVHISVDGHKDLDLAENPVYKIAEEYKALSHHSVTTNLMPHNLGLLNHFKTALTNFFKQNRFGIILEDDMEFSPSFIEYIDTYGPTLLSQDIWSICGHNPIDVYADQENHSQELLSFFYTHTHTIWGWATSAKVVEQFLKFLGSNQLGAIAREAIRTQVPLMSTNPFIRRSFESTWNFKLNRNLESSSPNWDNLWVIAAWHYKKPSIMPSRSLTVEGRDQTNGQTHAHGKKMVKLSQYKIEINHSRPDSVKVRRERQLMEVWGISTSTVLKRIFNRWKSI